MKQKTPELPTHLTNQAFELPQDSEIIIKPKKRIGAYDAFNNNPSDHLKRVGWTPNFNFNWPEDVGLGIEKSINRKEISKFQEIYFRFLNLGIIDQWGTHCILMSSVLRKVLAHHGIKSKIKQVVSYWQNEEKAQVSIIGAVNGRGNNTELNKDTIDTHVVVVSNGYILDFAMSSIHYQFGLTSPRACIGIDTNTDEYQDFGIAGECAWEYSSSKHPIIKHWQLEQKPLEQEIIRHYFREFQF